MKRIFLLLMIIMNSLILFGCKKDNNGGNNSPDDNLTPPIIENNIPYENLYFKKRGVEYPEISGKNVYKANYGYINKFEQGYNHFSYMCKTNNSFYEMSLKNERWEYEESYLDEDVMHSTLSTQAVRMFSSPYTGEALISGKYFDVSSKGNSRIIVMINETEVYRTSDQMLLKPGDTEGYYLDFSCNLKENDRVYFILTAIDQEVTISFNPTIDFKLEGEKSLHYILPEGIQNDTYIGDVHPFYDNGKMYMYYLNTAGLFQSCLLTSDNMIHYNRSICESHSSNPPEQDNYFVLGVAKYKDNKYRSYFGLGDGYGCSVSDDLHIWSNANTLDEKFRIMYRLYFDYDNYPAGGRDPYIFYDENIDRYCVIAMAYKTKADRYLVLYVSDDNEGKYFTQKPIELLNFKTGDPECPMAMKIKNRWYIFASIYGTSSHGVGRLSYWIGDENKDITEVDWKSKEMHYLEGDDLSAAQLVKVEDKQYLYGWIPQIPVGGTWGGYLNIAREVIQLEEGILGTRLDPVLTKILSRGKLFDITKDSFCNNNGFAISNNSLSSNGYASINLNTKLKRNIIDCNVNFQDLKENNEVSFVFSQNNVNVKVSVVYDGQNTYLKVSRIEGIRTIEYSQIKINGDNKNIKLKIVSEGNIMEIFANEKTGLIAHTDLSVNSFSDFMIITNSTVNIDDLTISKLADYYNILD